MVVARGAATEVGPHPLAASELEELFRDSVCNTDQGWSSGCEVSACMSECVSE